MKNFFLCTTEAVKKEIVHYELDNFLEISEFMIFPLEQKDFTRAYSKNSLIKELDEADQSIWIVSDSNRDQDMLVLTDDGALTLECYLSDIKSFRLPVFLLFLLENDLISKNRVHKCLKYWNKVGRYSQKHIKRWKKDLREY